MSASSSPCEALHKLAESQGLDIFSEEFAHYLDSQDQLASFRDQFVFPRLGTLPCDTMGNPDEPCTYLLGNSLGLKPKKADKYMQEQLDNWGNMAAFMHMTGRVPAAYADQPGKASIARIVGAKAKSEVAIMNGLTVNLHLFMVAFFKPAGQRTKILIEDHAFPSDRYAARSLLEVLKLGEENLVLVRPRDGEHTLRTEDILHLIQREADSLALIMLPGVQYYTGQKLDMEAITREATSLAIPIGWDLAHAVGNVELRLHEWGVDFAVWCSYKYLNSGAGGIAGAFLHERHHRQPPAHLQGWWSNKQETRFEMREKIDTAVGAEAFRLCNPPPWLAALHLAALEIYDEAGMEAILKKQFLLTGLLEHLLLQKFPDHLDIITPTEVTDRGAQLSIRFRGDVSKVHASLQLRGVVCDLRDQVMRVAPAPLYNSFKDVWRFVSFLQEALHI